MYNIHTLYGTEERQFLRDNCVQSYVGRILRVFIYQWQFTPVLHGQPRSCVRVEVDFPVANSPYGLCGRHKVTVNLKTENGIPELRSRVKVEVAVLGSPSLIVPMVSVDVQQR